MSIKHLCCCLLLMLTTATLYAQDTTYQLKEVEVVSFLSMLKSSRTACPAVMAYQIRTAQQGNTLLPALNTVPGVRMEERSPGSYRLSIRGSLLRSPFGIRNIKVYLDEMPLTDAGGNTYLNLLDAGAINRIEILKGPDGSLYGPNSGGVIGLQITPTAADTNQLRVQLQGGSYGLFHTSAAYQHQGKNYQFQLFQGYQRSDGYRQNTALRHSYTQTVQQWQYKPGYNLKFLAFYTDLAYRTPGGLTLAQSKVNPRAARPATSTLPGAVTQQAGIKNRTLQGAIVHEAQFNDRLKHVITLFSGNTHFENPFITNYEARDENTTGFRTYLQLTDEQPASAALHWQWLAGMEAQQTSSDIINYGNRAGKRDTVQAADRLLTRQHFFFTRFSADIHQRWQLQGAISLNYYRYSFDQNGQVKVSFSPQLMPHLAMSYLFNPTLTGRVTVSRGYSPPATAEVRPSDNIINTTLQPETGWNFETGLRITPVAQRYSIDLSVFHYRMQNAIVRVLRDNGNEFFRNAGGTKQTGVELEGMIWLRQPKAHGFMRGIQLTPNYTYSHFRFGKYITGGKDFSGNRLTGVPQHIIVTGLLLQMAGNISFYASHNYTSDIPLNDAGSEYAPGYHLVQCKANWLIPTGKKYKITLQAGINNILNESYSLGNDLNAMGNRYYNPAPGRNYYGGFLFAL